MSFLTLKAFLKLIYLERYLMRSNFLGLYGRVRSHSLRKVPPTHGAVKKICGAVDVACIWYWKEVLCLQRSAVTTCLLRRHGIPAEMVIGAQQMPLRAHAWVEVEGQVVNDKPYMRDIYAVLDRC
jgi:hypothetical protein